LTEQSRTPETTTIVVGTGVDAASALASAIATPGASGDVLVLPSSLRRSDPLASAVRNRLRRESIASHLVLPENPAAELGRIWGAATRWATVEIRPPDTGARSIRLPASLLGGRHIWTATDVDAVRGSGPYILDLLARYVHPVQRLRHLAASSGADAAVDTNLALPISRSIIGKRLPEGVVVAVTGDPIAGELIALSLADEDLPGREMVTGPWEDRVVQRATELELGVRIPQHLSITVAGNPNAEIRAAIQRIAARIGVVVGDTHPKSPYNA
jgi:hypothetical protein